jgi:glycosyltransferase involved in cell wall biosynthesis
VSVTVITATMPGREALLAESLASVTAQTAKPADHLVAIDYVQRGGARPKNLLASAVESEWTATLDDDDVLYPDHLERLLDEAGQADVVYSWCDTSGPDPWEQYNQPFNPDLLRQLSIVSHNALIRTELVVDVGGWDEQKGYDWTFWHKCLVAGARFVCVPERTWLYRLDAGWWHESRPWLGAA